VEAYSDENETLWNQTYVDLTEKIKGEFEEIYEKNLPSILFFVIPIVYRFYCNNSSLSGRKSQ